MIKKSIKINGKDIPAALLVSKFQNTKNSLLTPTEAKKKNAQLKLYEQIAQIYEDYENYLEKII